MDSTPAQTLTIWPCRVCGLWEKTSSELIEHLFRYHRKRAKNLICGWKLEKSHHSVKNSTEVCGFLSNSKYRIDRHQDDVHRSKVLKCNECGKEIQKCNWSRHQNLHQTDEKRQKFVCDLTECNSKESEKCGREFKSYSALSAHQTPRLISCVEIGCDYKAKSEKEVKQHMLVKHLPLYREVNKTCSLGDCEGSIQIENIPKLVDHRFDYHRHIYCPDKKCEKFGVRILNQTELVEHKYDVHRVLPVSTSCESPIFFCEAASCTFSTSEKQTMVAHRPLVHTKGHCLANSKYAAQFMARINNKALTQKSKDTNKVSKKSKNTNKAAGTEEFNDTNKVASTMKSKDTNKVAVTEESKDTNKVAGTGKSKDTNKAAGGAIASLFKPVKRKAAKQVGDVTFTKTKRRRKTKPGSN